MRLRWLRAPRSRRKGGPPQAAAPSFLLTDVLEMHLTHTSAPAGTRGRDVNPTAISAIDFLKTLFAHTIEPIYICSFPNERHDEAQVGERHVVTRVPGHITSFVEKWDKSGRGL